MVSFTDNSLVLPSGIVASHVWRDYMSVSTMAAFEGCVASWAASKILPRHEGSPDVDAAVRGSLFHEIAERAVNEYKTGRAQVAEMTARVLTEKYGKEGARFYELFSRYMDTWFELEDVENVSAREVEKKLDHVIVGGVPLVGYVDRFDADGTVVDYKTNKKIKRPHRGFDQYGEQILLYSEALRLLREKVNGTGRLLYVSPGVRRVVWVSDDEEGTHTKGAIERLGRAWDAMRHACDTGEFMVRPSVLCAWCPLGKVCPSALLNRAPQVEMYEDMGCLENDIGGVDLVSDIQETVEPHSVACTVERNTEMFIEAKPWDGLVVDGEINAAHSDVTGLFGFVSLGTKSGLGFNDCLVFAKNVEGMIARVDKDYAKGGSCVLRVRLRGLVYGFAERIVPDGSDVWLDKCEQFMRKSLEFAGEFFATPTVTDSVDDFFN